MIALVSGSDGFIGRHLVCELEAQGWEVRELRSRSEYGDTVDVRDAMAVAKVIMEARPDVIFHLGGVSGPMVSNDSPATVTEVNCVGTINVLEAAVWSRVRRFVLASSISGYDAGTSAYPLPSSVYGATKRFGEFALRQYAHEGILEGVSAQIGSVYGPGRATTCVLQDMIRKVLDGDPITYDSANTVDLIHVRDCARYLAALGSLPDPKPDYRLVTACVRQHELARMVSRLHESILVPEAATSGNHVAIDSVNELLVSDTRISPEVSIEGGIEELLAHGMRDAKDYNNDREV